MHNLFVNCALLLTLAVCSQCYDFQDPYYNQVLAADIQELENATQYEEDTEELHSRRRRAVLASTTIKPTATPAKETCRPISYSPCCDVKETDTTPREQEYRKTCYKEIFGKKDDNKTTGKTTRTSVYDPFNCDKINKIRNDILCMGQCVAQKTKMADPEGNLVTTGLTKYLTDKYAGTWVASMAKTISTKCMKQVQEATAYFNKNKAAGTCNPAISELAFCFYREIQMNCPADQIQNPKRCDSFKSYAKNITSVMNDY
ncbi:hypothetical protein FQR65_LT04567 [Abscondita terminalis]|nr:hypothetical protein FQR65_LT04567 [Abscondita terminalis]